MVEMKDSEIKWIGNIPKHWEVHPVYSYFSERKNKNRLGKEQNLLSLSYGNIIKKDINSNGGLLPESFNTYNIIEENDIIIRPTDLQNDKRSLRTGLVKEHGIITSAYIDMKPKKEVNSHYFHYLLHSYDIQKVFYNMGNGVRQALNFSEFSKLMVFAPPLKEQNKIADFLDEKCAEIDSISAEIQEQVDTLEEYKKSVITEAVTKGLNPNAEMKDSGIEWIGQIPKGFEIKRIKHIGIYRNGLTYSPTETVDEKDGTLILRSSNVQNGKIVLDDNVYVSSSIPKRLMVQKDDILICSRNGSRELIGKNAIIENDIIASFGAFMMIYRCVSPKYMYYILNSNIFSYYLGSFFTSTINQLTGSNFGNMKIVYCNDISSQNEIVDYLDSKCLKIDGAIKDKQKQLEILDEYKKTLIYEYVTGKKEVA